MRQPCREGTVSLYCSNIERLLSELSDVVEETTRFADVELFGTTDQLVYFDIRDNLRGSPIQSYLELTRGDKRDRQAAEILGQSLLKNVRTALENEGR